MIKHKKQIKHKHKTQTQTINNMNPRLNNSNMKLLYHGINDMVKQTT